MRISHFFIDRPIFAAVDLDRVRDPRRGVVRPAAHRAVSGDRAAGHQRHRPVSRRQRRGRRRDGGRSARAADQRRRAHALHLVELDGRRALLDLGDVRSRHQSRYRAGAGAEPRGDRAAATARGRAQHRRDGGQGLARPDDGRAPVFARPIARHAVHLQLRQHQRRRRAEPHRGRRLDHGVRRPRLFDARLARSRPPAVARPDGQRRGRGAAAAKRAGRGRHPQPAAGGSARRLPDLGADARATRRSRTSSATSSSSKATTPSCG